MEFHIRTPSPTLRPFVHHFWLVSDDAVSIPRQTLFPDGGVTALFNLGAPQGLVNRETGTTTTYRDCWLAGERTQPFLLYSPQGTHIAGIRFRPGGAFPFLNLPLKELTNLVVEMDTIFGPDAVDTHHQLLDAQSPEAVFQQLETFLTNRFAPDRQPSRWMRGALGFLAARGTRRPVEQLAHAIGMGERRLHREFERTVGISPKLLHRILRFQRVIELEDRLGRINWASAAQGCGYYDQAHLIRDFKIFTGTTPATYRRVRLEYPNYLPEL